MRAHLVSHKFEGLISCLALVLSPMGVTGDHASIGVTYNGMAAMLSHMGKPDEALDLYVCLGSLAPWGKNRVRKLEWRKKKAKIRLAKGGSWVGMHE